MWINFVLRINAIRELLSWIGLLGEANYFNTIFGMVYDFLPFMILPLYTTMLKIDESLYEASSDLGASSLHPRHASALHARNRKRHYNGVPALHDQLRRLRHARKLQSHHHR